MGKHFQVGTRRVAPTVSEFYFPESTKLQYLMKQVSEALSAIFYRKYNQPLFLPTENILE